MTRLYLHVGALRARVLAAQLGAVLVLGLVEGLGLRGFLALPGEQIQRQLMLVGVGMAIVFLALAAFTWSYLRPVTRLLGDMQRAGLPFSQHEEAARDAALRFPLLSTAVALGVCALAVGAGLVVNLAVRRLDGRLAVGVALTSLTVALVGAAFNYVLMRGLLLPVTAHFRHEEVPPGVRVSVASKVTFAVVVLALLAAIPTAVISGRRIQVIQATGEHLHHQQLAAAIAYGGTVLPAETLRATLATIRLADGAHLRLTEHSGPTASPLPVRHAASYVAVVAEAPPRTDHGALVLTAVIMLALAVFVARLLGANVARDVALATERIVALTRSTTDAIRVRPLIAASPQFSDLRQLTAAVNDLLVRIAEIHVAHFVAIEKTLAADRLKMQFLANVSHDLRSPLNSILGFSELLLRDTERPLEPPKRSAVDKIHQNGIQLLRLIDQVLDLAKLEAARLTVHREDSMPAEVVRQALHEVQRGAGLPEGVTLETELQAGLPMIWVDAHRLSQALESLIRHCVEGLDRGGEVRVRVRVENLHTEQPGAVKQMLLIRVADTGRGLEGAEVGQLFVAFRRRPGMRGLGLGLPLAKALIEMHGGTLSVYSAPGVGTTFAADLPIVQKRVLGRLRPVKV